MVDELLQKLCSRAFGQVSSRFVDSWLSRKRRSALTIDDRQLGVRGCNAGRSRLRSRPLESHDTKAYRTAADQKLDRLRDYRLPFSQRPPLYAKYSGYRVRRSGAPERIRTTNLLIRSQMLYPVELRAHYLAKKNLAKRFCCHFYVCLLR